MSHRQMPIIVRRMTTGIFFKCYQKRFLKKNPRCCWVLLAACLHNWPLQFWNVCHLWAPLLKLSDVHLAFFNAQDIWNTKEWNKEWEFLKTMSNLIIFCSATSYLQRTSFPPIKDEICWLVAFWTGNISKRDTLRLEQIQEIIVHLLREFSRLFGETRDCALLD